VDEKGSEYILAHTGLRELDGHPLGGCGSGFWFSSRLYCPFDKGPGQHIIRCLRNKKCENENDSSHSVAAGMLLNDVHTAIVQIDGGDDGYGDNHTVRHDP